MLYLIKKGDAQSEIINYKNFINIVKKRTKNKKILENIRMGFNSHDNEFFIMVESREFSTSDYCDKDINTLKKLFLFLTHYFPSNTVVIIDNYRINGLEASNLGLISRDHSLGRLSIQYRY